MLRVKGDSMIEAGIYDGDQVIVERSATAANGEKVVALVEDSATVKTFSRKRDTTVPPENSSMEPIIVDEVTILGKVIGLIRMMRPVNLRA